MKELIKTQQSLLFQDKEIRRIWYKGHWYFSVVDIIRLLTNSLNASAYWRKLKQRLSEEGSEVVTFCHALKIKAKDGKFYYSDCAEEQGILRIIQSIPSKNAEPFKMWLAKVGKERIDEIQNPELAMMRMKAIYRAKGYTEEWIEKRSRGIAIRNELTDEWQDRGIRHKMEYALLTNEIMTGTFDMKVAEYKKFKGLKKENLRDHMDDMELIFTMLAEATTTRITRKKNSKGFPRLKKDAHDGGEATGKARKVIEEKMGERVIKSENYLNNKVRIKK